jgi:hypothetical protein
LSERKKGLPKVIIMTMIFLYFIDSPKILLFEIDGGFNELTNSLESSLELLRANE